jgi:hypothetical protein
MLLGVCAFGLGCRPSLDDLTVWKTELTSPDGRWIASARTIQNGGFGSANVHTIVYMRQALSATPMGVLSFNCEGGVPHPYVLDNVANAGGTINLTMNWVTPSHLAVTYNGHASLDFQAIKFAYIDISVQNIPSESKTIATPIIPDLRQKTTQKPLEQLQAKIDVVSVSNLVPLQAAGQFNNPSQEEEKRTPSNGSKDSLFLFPDKTYIYTSVTDLPPDTISDKGTWTLDGDIVQLESDKDVTWESKRAERRYILVRRRGHDRELFAVGIEHGLMYFEEHAKEDPEFMFLLNSLKREKTISEAETAALRKKLMQEKWKPDFYR